MMFYPLPDKPAPACSDTAHKPCHNDSAVFFCRLGTGEARSGKTSLTDCARPVNRKSGDFFDNDYQNGFVLLQDKKTAQLIAGLFIAGL
jgi:hypothetical protein